MAACLVRNIVSKKISSVKIIKKITITNILIGREKWGKLKCLLKET